MGLDIIHRNTSGREWRNRDLMFRIIPYGAVLGLYAAFSLQFREFLSGVLVIRYATRHMIVVSGVLLLTTLYGLLKKSAVEKTDKRLIWSLVYTIFVNDTFEELIFRAALYFAVFSISRSTYAAIIISSVVFGFQHGVLFRSSLVECVFYSLGGIAFAGLMIDARSLFVPWTAHVAATIGEDLLPRFRPKTST